MTVTIELLPTRVLFTLDQPVGIEIRGLTAPADLVVRHLGDTVMTARAESDGVIDVGLLPAGGYSVQLASATTAVEVVEDVRSVLRYGFVVDYRPGRDLQGVVDNLRRLHLSGVQFYDWAYRHADLLGGGDQYDDALGQPVSLATVRRLIDACHDVGADALGYAAVYAAGPNEWPKWEHNALLTATGDPYALGDFLFILDPAAPDWLEHFSKDLEDATRDVGFDGFHLDQYGYPKTAHRPDGTMVDVSESFRRMIDGVREALPDARLCFNNVNDFPTWVTARSDQDVVYIEVWTPQIELQHLAQTVTRARSVASGKPVVVAAYQHVYDSAPSAQADRATAFTMATLFSHGATHLLAGEADRILVDPYYVRNHQTDSGTAALLKRYYDFAVAHAELLFPTAITEVTASFAGDYNDDLDVSYDGVSTTEFAQPGKVWRRITHDGTGRYVIHLINLYGQRDTAWDAPRDDPEDPGPGTLRMRRMGPTLPRIRWADPDVQDHLVDVELRVDGDYLHATLPAPRFWQTVVIDPCPNHP